MVSNMIGFIFILNMIKMSVSFTNVETAFRQAELVDEIIPFAPSEQLSVNYNTGVTANLGNTLDPGRIRDPPELIWNADPFNYYTVLLIDADAPSRKDPSMRSWLHWLVGNIPGKDLAKGETLAEYLQPCPPPGFGPHRFVFLAYQQPRKVDFEMKPINNKTMTGRENFQAYAFAVKHRFPRPIAGNFFLAE